MSAQILFSRHDAVGLITLNRPEVLNAFADRMRDELVDVVREAAEDAAIRAIVITGAGRGFCTGADVRRMHELVCREEWDTLEALIEALRLGIFNRLVDDGEVVNETMALAARIAAKSPLAVALAKQSIRQSYGEALDDALHTEGVNQLRLFKTSEARDAMRAFVARKSHES